MFMGFSEFGKTICRSFLSGERTLERLVKMLGKARSVAESEIIKIEAAAQQLAEPQRAQMTKACAVGCAHCCYQPVRAEIPEMLWVGHYIHTHFTEEERNALRKRLDDYREKTKPLSDPEHRFDRQACPFLVEEKCTIYEARPFVCQRHHSTNLEACKVFRFSPRQTAEIPFVPPQNFMMAHIGLGIRKEMHEAGLDISRVEVGLAAQVVLDNPDAAERYFAGEDLFAEVRTDTPEVVDV